MKSLEKAAALVLTRDYLIAANTGRPFTTWGLDAVAYGSLTSKTEAKKGLDDPNVRFGSEEMEPAARALINDGYATVIILRLTESTWSVLKKEWDEVSNDLSLLVLIEGLETLVWEVDSQKTTWRRSQDADVVRLQSFRD